MGRISGSQERVYVPENELKEGRARLVAYSPHGSANQIGKAILHIKGFSLETDNNQNKLMYLSYLSIAVSIMHLFMRLQMIIDLWRESEYVKLKMEKTDVGGSDVYVETDGLPETQRER